MSRSVGFTISFERIGKGERVLSASLFNSTYNSYSFYASIYSQYTLCTYTCFVQYRHYVTNKVGYHTHRGFIWMCLYINTNLILITYHTLETQLQVSFVLGMSQLTLYRLLFFYSQLTVRLCKLKPSVDWEDLSHVTIILRTIIRIRIQRIPRVRRIRWTK